MFSWVQGWKEVKSYFMPKCVKSDMVCENLPLLIRMPEIKGLEALVKVADSLVIEQPKIVGLEALLIQVPTDNPGRSRSGG